MNDLSNPLKSDFQPLDPRKFVDPDVTAGGEVRASVPLAELETLWFNTGTLCNITCANCYIESSPTNDRLQYLRTDELIKFLDEIALLELGTREIGFTGGEPFMNPYMCDMLDAALERGFEVLVLTNAMQPMQRKHVMQRLLQTRASFGAKLTLRVSLDHYARALHEEERGPNTWDRALSGMDWLNENGFRIAIAGRTCWGETEDDARAGYDRLIRQRGWNIDADDPSVLVLFPEMDATRDVPEITTACWDILGKRPDQQMCATSRMVVKRKGAEKPTVLPCTLLPYDQAFEMGESLSDAAQADGGNFRQGAVKLNHPHCARFCVLGGASCSG